MQKQCPGKFHGNAIKYIDESQKYCAYCQQQIDLQNAERKEKAKKVGKAIIKGSVAVVTTGVAVLTFVGKIASLLSGEQSSTPKNDS